MPYIEDVEDPVFFFFLFTIGEGLVEAVQAGTHHRIRLVPVVVGLVGTVDGNIQVAGLFLGEDGQLDVELGQMGTSDFLIELLGEHVDTEGELLGGGPEGNLGQSLVGERAGHDE